MTFADVGSSGGSFVYLLTLIPLLNNRLAYAGNESVVRHSNMCRPACHGDMVCVEQTSQCSFTECPSVQRSCVLATNVPPGLQPSSEQTATSNKSRASLKPGCRTSFPNSPCVTQCRQDSDCRLGSLCCYNGCGQVCKPDTRGSLTPKRGTCPWYLIGMDDSCTVECLDDQDCLGMQKCCQTSCGSTCSMPCFYWLSDSSRWQLSPRCNRDYPQIRPSFRLYKRLLEAHNKIDSGSQKKSSY